MGFQRFLVVASGRFSLLLVPQLYADGAAPGSRFGPEPPPRRLAIEATREEILQLRRKIDELVRRELTQHWYPQAVDRERGGFHQTLARDWSPRPDENVFLVYQARMTWTAAAFAQYSPPHREEFVGYARHGIEFLDRVMRRRGVRRFPLGPRRRGATRSQTRRREARLWHGVCRLRRQQGARGDRRRPRSQSRPRRLRLAREHMPTIAKHGGYFEAIRRDGTPILSWERRRPDRQAGRSCRASTTASSR